ncbi:hypothetical protein GCM10023149_15760 [Mucilaginibacter gynuensis]|uniref:FecR family protein n=1 Tax=Mucilaginibacter gynuensis TaxID=1302236 RepID=A0ABP8G6C5_9SPHI
MDQPGERFVETWYESLEITSEDPLKDEHKSDAIKKALQTALFAHVRQPQKIRRINPWYYAAAACFLFAMLGVWMLNKPAKELSADTYTMIKTGPGALKKIVLPDSSEVWLNAGSALRYNDRTFAARREIYLDEGEAFFSVVKNPARPFAVYAQGISTRVLGTSFNVKAYRKLSYASVQVKTGRVQVNTGKYKLDTVTGSQSIVYDKRSGKTIKNTADETTPGSWVNGITVLQEATFDELALALKNQYNVTLTTSNAAIKRHHYTINILQQKTADETLKLICAIHQNKYRKDKNEIIIY